MQEMARREKQGDKEEPNVTWQRKIVTEMQNERAKKKREKKKRAGVWEGNDTAKETERR